MVTRLLTSGLLGTPSVLRNRNKGRGGGSLPNIPNVPVTPSGTIRTHVASLNAQYPMYVKGFPVVYVLTRTKYALKLTETVQVTFTESSTSGQNNFKNTLADDLDAAILNSYPAGQITRSGNTLTFNWKSARNFKISRPTSENFVAITDSTTLAISVDKGTVFGTGKAIVSLKDQTQGHAWWKSARAGAVPGSLRWNAFNDNLTQKVTASSPGTAWWGAKDTKKLSLAFGLLKPLHDLLSTNLWASNTIRNNIKLNCPASNTGLSLPTLTLKDNTPANATLVSAVAKTGFYQNVHQRCFISVDLTQPTMALGLKMFIDDVDVTPTSGTWVQATDVVKSLTSISNASPAVFTLNAHGFVNGNPIVLSTTGTLPAGLTAGVTYYVVSAATNTFSLSTVPSGTAIATTTAGSGTHTATQIGGMSFSSYLNNFLLMGGTGNADDVIGDLDFFWLKTDVALNFADASIRDQFWYDTLDDSASAFKGGAPIGGGTNRPDVYMFGNKDDWTANPATNNYGTANLNCRVPTVATNGFTPSDKLQDIPMGIPTARTIYATANKYEPVYTEGSSTGLPTGSNIVTNVAGLVDVSGWKTIFEDDFKRSVPTTPDQVGFFNRGNLRENNMNWETALPQFQDQNATTYNLRFNSATGGVYLDFHGTSQRSDAIAGAINTDPIVGSIEPGVCEVISFADDTNGVLNIGAEPLPISILPEFSATRKNYRNVPFYMGSGQITSDGRGALGSGNSGPCSNMFLGISGAALIEARIRFVRVPWPLSMLGRFEAFWNRRSPNGPEATTAYEKDLVEVLGMGPDVWTSTEFPDGNNGKKVNRNVRGLEQGLSYGPWMYVSDLVTPDSPAGNAKSYFLRENSLVSPNRNGALAGTLGGLALDETNPMSNANSLGASNGGYRFIVACAQVEEGYGIYNKADFTSPMGTVMQVDWIRVRQPIGEKFIRRGTMATVGNTTSATTF